MKNLRKIISAALVIVLSLSCAMLFSSCGKTSDIALITDKGNIDDKSFNQGAWEGVLEYAEKNNISHKYYKPEEGSDAGYLASIDLAVKGGAKIVVTPGFLFEVPVYEAQTKYPDVKFILLDGAPHTAWDKEGNATFNTEANVASVMYQEEQSGYLAGYAAVIDGYTKLGFMGGMAVPAVQAFGYGYLQGAEAAAQELGVEVEVQYHYTGNFDENDTNKQTAKTMYQNGAEVIFACGGSVGKSVMSAAEEAEAKVIGVDVDQRKDSETVITSATKGLGSSVVQVLEAIYADKFDDYAGNTTFFTAENDGVGLPDNFDRFSKFTTDDYKVIFDKLAKNEISLVRTFDVEDASGYATKDELTTNLSLDKVSVTTVQ
ncbi:BMP family ABC transporter substrate-binding protein [Sedimentibacter sp. zth1]|uniref:BMP family lipoprotein n=1 Tax=Sedimentibacter sp. zth1 TaxID=2816908 RepID=UPI001A92CD67|nr:BMP family ABC transporter substrate-binding protein [Sedimentibacter sp. zth1]QSX06780.1 BMP family ABC transporter substrate-binding protein [Sedimentibacter sp. zth1]